MKILKLLSFSLFTFLFFVSLKTQAYDPTGDAPQILTSSLPNGGVGMNYIATIRSRDVNLGDFLQMVALDLPTGLSLENCTQFVLSNSERLHCDLTGVTPNAGIYEFKIGVLDNHGNADTHFYEIEIK